MRLGAHSGALFFHSLCEGTGTFCPIFGCQGVCRQSRSETLARHFQQQTVGFQVAAARCILNFVRPESLFLPPYFVLFTSVLYVYFSFRFCICAPIFYFFFEIDVLPVSPSSPCRRLGARAQSLMHAKSCSARFWLGVAFRTCSLCRASIRPQGKGKAQPCSGCRPRKHRTRQAGCPRVPRHISSCEN